MYAIIEDSGRQYRVQEKDRVDVDLRELPEGAAQIEFNQVLLIGDEKAEGSTRIGQPWIEGAKVIAKIEDEIKADKIRIIKFQRRKRYRRRAGHRQRYLRVVIEKIVA